MSNKIKQEMNRIEIPKELSARSKMGIIKANKEIQKSRKGYSLVSIGIVAALLISIGTFALFNNKVFSPNGTTRSDGVKIPSIQLPKGNSEADMVGLIVYNGKFYTEARTDIDAAKAKAILGEKLGTTKGNIEERSDTNAYDEEFASTIPIEDVYSVKGYDKNFRIMTYVERDGKPYAKFYENDNGITVKSGEDVFGNLKIAGNVSSAEYRTFSDWDKMIGDFHPISDIKVLNVFALELNKTKPFPLPNSLYKSRNNENFREVTIQLNDGTKVILSLFKEGYIYYGFNVLFKMDNDVFSKMWSQLQ
jgi:hypothetical protein